MRPSTTDARRLCCVQQNFPPSMWLCLMIVLVSATSASAQTPSNPTTHTLRFSGPGPESHNRGTLMDRQFGAFGREEQFGRFPWPLCNVFKNITQTQWVAFVIGACSFLGGATGQLTVLFGTNGATYAAGGLVPGSWAQVKGTGLSAQSRTSRLDPARTSSVAEASAIPSHSPPSARSVASSRTSSS